MKKIGCILCFSMLAIAAQAQQIPKWQITDVEKYMSDTTRKVLVISFWATFCKPCVAEIPSFISITDRYKSQNVSLLLVSLDLPSYYPKRIASFARKQGFKAHVVWLNETNADYFCPKIDKSWSGSIPGTLILNTKNGYRKFFEEEMEAADFEKELQLALASE